MRDSEVSMLIGQPAMLIEKILPLIGKSLSNFLKELISTKAWLLDSLICEREFQFLEKMGYFAVKIINTAR